MKTEECANVARDSIRRSLFLTVCGGAPDEQRADATPPPRPPYLRRSLRAVPDACTFFSRTELETNVGWELAAR